MPNWSTTSAVQQGDLNSACSAIPFLGVSETVSPPFPCLSQVPCDTQRRLALPLTFRNTTRTSRNVRPRHTALFSPLHLPPICDPICTLSAGFPFVPYALFLSYLTVAERIAPSSHRRRLCQLVATGFAFLPDLSAVSPSASLLALPAIAASPRTHHGRTFRCELIAPGRAT